MALKPPIIELDYPTELMLEQAAISVRNAVLQRAFPASGEPAKSVLGETVSPLSPRYLALKVAAGRPGIADQRLTGGTALQLKITQRAPGLRAIGFSGNTRDASGIMARARAKLAKQKAKDEGRKTRKTRKSSRTRRPSRPAPAQSVAEGLQARNDFWPMSAGERKLAVDTANQFAAASASKAIVKNNKIVVRTLG